MHREAGKMTDENGRLYFIFRQIFFVAFYFCLKRNLFWKKKNLKYFYNFFDFFWYILCVVLPGASRSCEVNIITLACCCRSFLGCGVCATGVVLLCDIQTMASDDENVASEIKNFHLIILIILGLAYFIHWTGD